MPLAGLHGTVVVWGSCSFGVCDIPPPNADFIAIAAGEKHCLGLKSDGQIVAWGDNIWGQRDIPSPNTDFVAVAACESFSLGLKTDGRIIAWGNNDYNQMEVPTPNGGFVAIAAGYYHGLGLKADGSIIGWGGCFSGSCDPPSPNAGFVAIAAGEGHSLGLKSDGRIVAWGSNYSGQCNVPDPNADFVAAAAGGDFSLGLKRRGITVRVPSEQPTLQLGINIAGSGDTVLVAPGTYAGTGNKNLDFYGRNIVLLSESGPEATIIDCQGDGRAIYLHSGETNAAIIDGFTMRGGQGFEWPLNEGGAISCMGASPTIQKCILTENTAFGGGAIALEGGTPRIVDCVVSGNRAEHNGGGIIIIDSTAEITGCLIEDNLSGWIDFGVGGGVCVKRFPRND